MDMRSYINLTETSEQTIEETVSPTSSVTITDNERDVIVAALTFWSDRLKEGGVAYKYVAIATNNGTNPMPTSNEMADLRNRFRS